MASRRFGGAGMPGGAAASPGSSMSGEKAHILKSEKAFFIAPRYSQDYRALTCENRKKATYSHLTANLMATPGARATGPQVVSLFYPL